MNLVYKSKQEFKTIADMKLLAEYDKKYPTLFQRFNSYQRLEFYRDLVIKTIGKDNIVMFPKAER